MKARTFAVSFFFSLFKSSIKALFIVVPALLVDCKDVHSRQQKQARRQVIQSNDEIGSFRFACLKLSNLISCGWREVKRKREKADFTLELI